MEDIADEEGIEGRNEQDGAGVSSELVVNNF
jgi:hypothetical protein